MVRHHRCEISIDVFAESPEQAACEAWLELTSPGSFYPVVQVTDPQADVQMEVDLQEFNPVGW